MKSNPKRFFSYLNSKRKIRNTLTSLQMDDGKMSTTPKETANRLAHFFASTYINEISDSPQPENRDCPQIGDIIFDGQDIMNILRKLNISKSMGPDGVHPKLLNYLCSDENFISAITTLFQRIYDSGQLPDIWKSASVTALRKKGLKSNAENYRPISLTCILSKIFEKILRNHVLDHFMPHVYANQYGFLPRKSCLSNLLDCMDHVYDILDSGEDADIIYLDFMKAFDSVSHKRLLSKLDTYGITGKTWAVIEDILSNRTFRVRVGDTYSDCFKVTSGVPQGSVLGPLLFLVFINDLPNGLHSYMSLFADDVKLICSTKDFLKTQDDLDSLDAWQKSWLLSFNTKYNKCKVIYVGKNNTKNEYFLSGKLLPETDVEKDLGVYVKSDLNWKYHIQKSISKAKAIIGWVTRNVISREKTVMLNIYMTLVRPHLEYCTQLWNPTAEHGNWRIIMEIEGVQRAFTRLIENSGLDTYKDRLQYLNLTTLLERRMRGDLIETFKILSGKTDYGKNLFNVSRSGTNLIYVSKRGSAKQSFLSNRVVSYWNKLPGYVKLSDSVESFKTKIESYKGKNQKSQGNYWELSEEIFSRINETDRDQYVNFMTSNPDVMKRRKITSSIK